MNQQTLIADNLQIFRNFLLNIRNHSHDLSDLCIYLFFWYSTKINMSGIAWAILVGKSWTRKYLGKSDVLVFFTIMCIGYQYPSPSFLPSHPSNWQTAQAFLFRQSPLYIGFSWTPLNKSWIFQWNPKILKFFILNTILSFKSN